MRGRAEYVVLAKRSDCGDLAVFTVEDSLGRDHWPSFAQARAVMKADYGTMLAEYPTCFMTKAGKRRRKCRIRRTGAEFSAPIWDGERQRESRLRCRWRVVAI